MSANSLRGEVEVQAGGRTFTLLFDFNALIAFEDATGLKPPQVLELLQDPAEIPSRTLRSLFRAGLSEHHPEVTDQDAGRIISALGGATAAFVVAVRAINVAFGWEKAAEPGEDANAAGDPPRPPKRRGGTGTTSKPAGPS